MYVKYLHMPCTYVHVHFCLMEPHYLSCLNRPRDGSKQGPAAINPLVLWLQRTRPQSHWIFQMILVFTSQKKTSLKKPSDLNEFLHPKLIILRRLGLPEQTLRPVSLRWEAAPLRSLLALRGRRPTLLEDHSCGSTEGITSNNQRLTMTNSWLLQLLMMICA